MAIAVATQKIAVNVKLNNGTSETGKVKTLSVSLGAINKDTFDASKAYAIMALLAPCLEKEVYSLDKVETSSITNE